MNEPQFDADEPECKSDGRQREGRRIAVEHEQDQPGEHHGRQIVADKCNH